MATAADPGGRVAGPGWPRSLLDGAHGAAATTVERRTGPLDLAISSPDTALAEATALRITSTRAATGAPPRWGRLAVSVVDDGQAMSSPSPVTGVRTETGPVRLLGTAAGVTAYADGEGLVWALDLEHGRAVRWSPEPGAVPLWERASPLRVALHWWAAAHDGALLHAAAVAGPGGAALLVGPAGAGKSTTAMACLGSELDVLGDDYVLLATDPVEVSPLFSAAKLDPAALELLPHLAERVIGVGVRGKSLVTLDDGDLPGSVPLRAVCAVEQVPGTTTTLEAAGRGDVLRRLAPSSVFQLPGASADVFRAAGHAVRAAAPYRLRVGDPRGAVDVLASLLR